MHPFSPLLPQNEKSNSSSPLDDAPSPSTPPSFPLRIKLSSTDITLTVNSSVSVATLKQWILQHSPDTNGTTNNNHNNNNTGNGSSNNSSSNNNSPMYLRLIVRGRLLAPDTATLQDFNINQNDVVHAVLAREGRGAQARMLRRLNGSNNPANSTNNSANNGGSGGNNVSGVGIGVGGSGGGVGGNGFRRNFYGNTELNRLWRRIGIDSSGVVVSRNEDGNDSDSEESEEEDLEGGEQRQSSGSGRRERRGFDRLRSTGMSRDEVNIIRSYFSRSVDRYIERRRILIRASSQLRNSLGENGRDRLNTGDSNNSLLDNGEEEEGGMENVNLVESTNNPDDVEDGNVSSNNETNDNTPVEGEEILLDRRRMEDEWMSTQGPYSEFRMNLNTSNPLLLSAISPPSTSLSNMLSTRRSRGLFRRPAPDSDSDEDLMFGSLGPNPMVLPNTFRPYAGPLPSAGTDKDFLWGFILGFFVGFIMLFWVWMPTVPHRQKIGIILGVICQLGLNLLRKGEGDVAI